MRVLSTIVPSVAYAVITKSVGSGYRIADDLNAPKDILWKTVKREGTLLSLTTAFTTGIQCLFTKTLFPVLDKNPQLRKHELILRALVTAPALVVAELVSRKKAPKPGWASLLEDKGPHLFHAVSNMRVQHTDLPIAPDTPRFLANQFRNARPLHKNLEKPDTSPLSTQTSLDYAVSKPFNQNSHFQTNFYV